MAMNLNQFLERVEKNQAVTQAELYRQADLDVNGDPKYYGAFDAEISRHGIGARVGRCMIGISEF